LGAAILVATVAGGVTGDAWAQGFDLRSLFFVESADRLCAAACYRRS